MANALSIQTRLRPCYVYEKADIKKKALFHCWCFESSVGRYPGETVACTMAIVEMENGRVIVVPPASIQFLDNKFIDYCWDRKGE